MHWNNNTISLPDARSFVKWGLLALVVATGFRAISPNPAPAQKPAVDQREAGRWVIATRDADIRRGSAARARSDRALNRCMPAAMDRKGKVDWSYVKGCYERTQ